MGILFVLIFWAVASSVASVFFGSSFYIVARWLTRGISSRPRWFLRVALLFPLACLGWAGAVFVFHAVVNVTLLHRDVGLGDGWDCPLPDGYSLSFTDIMAVAAVYKTETQPYGLMNEDDAITNVASLQIYKDFLLGGIDTRFYTHPFDQAATADQFFVLDTKTGVRQMFGARDDLEVWCRKHQTRLDLRPVESLYNDYRFTWFEIFCLGLLLIPPGIFFALLLRRGWRLIRDDRENRELSKSIGP